MFKAFKKSIASTVDFIDFLNHISISQWDVETRRQKDSSEALLSQQE